MSKTIRVVTIDNANINSEEFKEFYQRSFNVELEIEALKEAAKDIVKEMNEKCKIKPALYNKFVKSRVKATTKNVVKDGETFAVLNDVLDN